MREEIVTYEGQSKGDVATGVPAVLEEINFTVNQVEIDYKVTPMPKRFLQCEQEMVTFTIRGPESAVKTVNRLIQTGINEYNRRVGRA